MLLSVGEALIDVVEGAAVPGGGPMNVAVAAARLGYPSYFGGRLSTDDYGTAIRDHLVNSGVRLDVTQRGSERTATATVTINPSPRFVFDGDGTADASMTDIDLSPLGSDPYVLHGGTLGMFRGSTADVLAGVADAHNGLVSFDPNVRPRVIEDPQRWWSYANHWLDAAHIVKVSDEDLNWMHPGLDATAVAQEYFDRGVVAVLETRGADGVLIHLAAGEVVAVEGHPVEVADTVGAGDTFIAGVLVALGRAGVETGDAARELGAESWKAAVQLGVRAAAVTCSRVGANPPWRHELETSD